MIASLIMSVLSMFGGNLVRQVGDQPPATREVVTIVCKPDAVVRGIEILLSDIAEVQAKDTAFASRVANLSFGRRPTLQVNRVMTQREIHERLLAEGIPADALRLLGAREVVVQAPIARITPTEISDASETVLKAILEQEGEDIEHTISQSIKQVLVPPGRRSLDLKANLRQGTLNLRSAVIEVTVMVDGEPYQVVPVQYGLKRFSEVLVTTRVIRRGEMLDDRNVEVRRVDAGTGATPFLGTVDALYGKVAARDLRAEERLTLTALANPAVIRRGDSVVLVVARGRIRIEARAIALADGAVGDRVMVTNLNSGRPVQAIVETAGVVLVP